MLVVMVVKVYTMLHLNASIFTKLTMYDWKHYVHIDSKMVRKVRPRLETLSKAA